MNKNQSGVSLIYFSSGFVFFIIGLTQKNQTFTIIGLSALVIGVSLLSFGKKKKEEQEIGQDGEESETQDDQS